MTTKVLPAFFRDEAVSIGAGRYVSFVKHLTSQDGERFGLLEWHDCRDEKMLSAGTILFDVPAAYVTYPESPKWRLVSLDPIHLEPSIACYYCDSHGYIKSGQWVDA